MRGLIYNPNREWITVLKVCLIHVYIVNKRGSAFYDLADGTQFLFKSDEIVQLASKTGKKKDIVKNPVSCCVLKCEEQGESNTS